MYTYICICEKENIEVRDVVDISGASDYPLCSRHGEPQESSSIKPHSTEFNPGIMHGISKDTQHERLHLLMLIDTSMGYTAFLEGITLDSIYSYS